MSNFNDFFHSTNVRITNIQININGILGKNMYVHAHGVIYTGKHINAE